MIKTLTPYYITVPYTNPSTDVVCDSFVLKIYIWKGTKNAVPSAPEYEKTILNATASNGSVKLDISKMINDFIEFSISNPGVTSLESGNNQAWVKTEIYYSDAPTIPENQNITFALKGYGWFLEGENPQIPTNKILLTGDEFKVNRNGFFVLPIKINEVASTINAENETKNIDFQDTYINVLDNDDLGFTPTSIVDITTSMTPTVGVLTIEGALIKFTAGTSYTTPQTFTYTIRDNALNESTATVTLNISDLPAGITAVNDFYTSDAITPQDLLVLENDVLGTLPTNIISINTTGFTLGSVSIDGTNQKLIFTPNGTPGTSSFTYTIRDSTMATSNGTVSITIEGLYGFYYEGTLPAGKELPGNVVYIDINGEYQFEDNLYLGTCVLIVAKSIVSTFRAQTCTP